MTDGILLKWMAVSAVAFACSQMQPGDIRQQTVPTYRSAVPLIEVYATVTDQKGKYVTGLTQDQFEIRDDGIPCPISLFEPATSSFSCAILLDRTGSMGGPMPLLKNATLRFIDSFREDDSFAVYSFNTTLNTLQDFTRDKNAAKQAALRTIAQGATALFDSLAEVALQLSTRNGKKVIVAFTDGSDNSSYLNAGAVIRRAKMLGIPVYAAAQGEALADPGLMKTLKDVAQATGGSCYPIKRMTDIEAVFRDISQNIQNSYMIGYYPPESNGSRWHAIRVSVTGMKNLRIRAREGWNPR